MKKKALALALCISMAAVMFTGCKTVVQNPTSTTPQVISPEVTIQQESKEEPNVINVSGSGEAKLTPDIATASIQVRARIMRILPPRRPKTPPLWTRL